MSWRDRGDQGWYQVSGPDGPMHVRDLVTYVGAEMVHVTCRHCGDLAAAGEAVRRRAGLASDS